MKKVLFVCDGDHFANGAFRFVKLLHDSELVFVKGLFFSPIDIGSMLSSRYKTLSRSYAGFRKEKEIVNHSIAKFTNQCDDATIRYTVKNTNDRWHKSEFVKESRFADLIVISEALFCLNPLAQQPNYFMQEALRGAECPVVLVPETFKEVERLAVAYDGTKESMFALKQFVHLLPQFNSLSAEFLYIRDEEDDDIPKKELLQEFVQCHFSSFAEVKLRFNAKKDFSTWLQNEKNVMLVAGSYSRSDFSNFIKRSFSDEVIHDRSCPVFIAHP